ncbi:hypothetical protein Taro_024021 [Colocasia esculenta]|uniref:Uncharacterized protein n=1 Tax=Colocasia esculenta TaxID=4460 RepID=A0A843VA34_COLES|nr:hypothetical protein [Colocasia esculenta]
MGATHLLCHLRRLRSSPAAVLFYTFQNPRTFPLRRGGAFCLHGGGHLPPPPWATMVRPRRPEGSLLVGRFRQPRVCEGRCHGREGGRLRARGGFVGGVFWFQNLTELPQGVMGSIFPLLVAGLHFVNVQISFQSVKLKEMPGIFGLLARIKPSAITLFNEGQKSKSARYLQMAAAYDPAVNVCMKQCEEE